MTGIKLPAKPDYRAVTNHYFDKLELLIKDGKRVRVWYVNNAGKKKKTESVLNRIDCIDGVEYLVLENQLMIRLDRLVDVNGIPVEFVL